MIIRVISKYPELSFLSIETIATNSLEYLEHDASWYIPFLFILTEQHYIVILQIFFAETQTCKIVSVSSYSPFNRVNFGILIVMLKIFLNDL